MRRWVKGMAVVLLSLSQGMAQEAPRPRSESLSDLLRGDSAPAAITSEGMLERVAIEAEHHYKLMLNTQDVPDSPLRVLPSVDLMKAFLLVATYLEPAVPADEEIQEAARQVFQRQKNTHNHEGLLRLRREAIPGSRERQVYDAALQRLAAFRASVLLDALVVSGREAGKPEFWNAYESGRPLWRRLGYLTPREEVQIPPRMASSARHSGSAQAVSNAGRANVLLGIVKLERSLQDRQAANDFDADNRLAAGVAALLRAEQFDMLHSEVRQAVHSLEPALASNLAFRSDVLQAINLERERAGRLPHRNFRPAAGGAETVAGRKSRGVLTEPAEVTGKKPDRLNPASVRATSLHIIVRDAAGLQTLTDHLGLAADEALLFTGLLANSLGEKDYRTLLRKYRGDPRIPKAVRKSARGREVFLGRALFKSPHVRGELTLRQWWTKVKEATRNRDHYDLWRHIGDGWSAQAQEQAEADAPMSLDGLASEMAAWREAQRSYVRASERLPHRPVIKQIHLVIGDTGQKILAARQSLLAYLQEGGLDYPAMTEFLEPALFAIARPMLEEQYARDTATVIEEAYVKVFESPVKTLEDYPPGTVDLDYTLRVTAIGRLTNLERELGRLKQAAHHQKLLMETVAVNGFQFFSRYLIRSGILGDREAEGDLIEAERLLRSQAQDGASAGERQRADRTLRQVESYLKASPGAKTPSSN